MGWTKGASYGLVFHVSWPDHALPGMLKMDNPSSPFPPQNQNKTLSATMIPLRLCKCHYPSSFLLNSTPQNRTARPLLAHQNLVQKRKFTVTKCSAQEPADNKPERRTFLSLEEAGLVEISGLSTHERFLCRLTISSLNLLRVIAEQEGCEIEELNAGRVCDWFLKDKLKREQNIESAVLQWDDSDFQF